MATSTTSTSATAVTAEPTARSARSRPVLWRAGLVAGIVASVATASIAALARGAGVAFGGDVQIPAYAFAQLTMFGALAGIGLARAISARSTRARSTFVRVTAGLTAASVIPDLLADAGSGTRLTLAFTHLVAAAIIVPTLARRLAR